MSSDARSSSNGSSAPSEEPDAGTSSESVETEAAENAETNGAPSTIEIVGVGASAGGLQAFSDFFKALPENPGMAFVLVQHLAPNHESELAELLQNHTAMRVAPVEDGEEAKPNGVYVIPPGKTLRIEDGVLRLEEPDLPHGHRAPIDVFFRSLASDQGDRAACVVLSGTGSDGSLGLKALKEAGGLTLAQTPDDAEYDGMPQSAIATGFVDVVLPASDLGTRLVELRRTGVPLPDDSAALPEDDTEALSAIFTQLRAGTGHDFSRYKKSTVLRRIGRRMQVQDVDALPSYLRVLRKSGTEVEALLKDLLISVTSFFRDPEVFTTVEHEIIPKLFEDKGAGDQVRVWVPGCATGEEAYSLAILLCEYASGLKDPPELQVFATDIDEHALAYAREGLYPEVIATDVTPERLEEYFERDGDAFRVRKKAREIVLFASHNLLKDPPFSKLDLISCRNLLIYLQRETQERLFELFAYALRSPGFLLLGTSESVETTKDLFTTVHKKHRIFRGRGIVRQGLRVPILRPVTPRRPAADPRQKKPPATIEDLHTRLLISHYTPPSVIVGADYEVLHSAGRVGRYLAFAPGEPTSHLLRLVPTGLRPELRTALYQAFEKGKSTDRLRVRARLGTDQVWVLLTVRPLKDPDTEGLAHVIFDEEPIVDPLPPEPSDSDAQPAVDHLEDELQRTQERLQSTVEEYETSNEELKASNEELLSMNEELQSTTEELETGREELQSMNEELSTVNQELKTKIEELNRANADLQNLINSTDVATLFLDRDLRIKRFTPRLTDLFNIINSDRGRPIGHLTHKITYGGFVDDARQVLDSLVPVEREVEGEDGRYFLTRIVPYRTSDDRIDGVVATFVDITRRVEAELAAKRREERFRRAIREAPIPVFLHAEDGEFLQISDAVTEITGYTPEDIPTVEVWAQRAYGDEAPDIRADIEQLYAADHRVDEGEYTVRTKAGEERFWQFSSAPIGRDGEGRRLVVSMAADITARKRAEAEREARARQQNVVASLGLYALSEPDLDALFERAVHFVQVTLETDCAKVLELQPSGEALFLRAGVGWKDGCVGRDTVPNNASSQAGFTLLQEAPVVVSDIAEEKRFSSPDLLTSHDMRSGMSVIIGAMSDPFGVLGTHAREPRPFSQADADFLQAVANVLGAAVRRAENREQLRDANEELEAYSRDLEVRVAERTELLGASESRLRTLYDIISQPTSDLKSQITHALEKAAELLELEVGLLSGIEDQVYTVVTVYGPESGLRAGTTFELNDTCCAITVTQDRPLAIEHLSESEFSDHPCAQALKVESYIGAPVHVEGEVVGTLSFSADAPRAEPFPNSATDFVSLLARWVGAALAQERIDRQLERSEQLLAGILLGSLEGTVALEAVRDDDGRIEDFTFLLVNPAAAEVYGQRAEDLIDTSYLARVPVTRENGVFDTLVRVAESGLSHREEIYFQGDGIDGWYDYTVVKLSDGVALSFRDITEQKQANEALRESEARFRELFESSPDAVFVEDLEGVVIDVNPAACRLHRADRDWLIGRSLLDLVPQDYRDEAMEDFGRLANGGPDLLESYSLTKDGEVVPVEVRTDRITYDGRDAVLLHVRDITERHQAEEALRESEQRFAKAFRASPVAVTISTLDEGRYIDVNDSFCALTGYKRLEIAGHTEADLGLMPDGAPPPGLDTLRAGGQVRDAEFQIRRKDGEIRDVLVSAEPLELGGIACVLGIGIDVTDRKRLEREVIEAAEQERRRIGQDLHDELGQQLTGAAFLAETLRQRLGAQDSSDADTAAQLTSLINDALAETRDLARLLSPVDIQAEGLVDALQGLADQTERVFDVSCLLETDGDVRVSDNVAATHLYRIAQEAVNNAVKHADPSEVAIRLSRTDDGLHLTIRDDGSGLDPSLFQRSSGLGLRTMQYRAALIGATLAIETDGPGTRLGIRLPS